MFTATAKTNVRLLSLDASFFVDNIETFECLSPALDIGNKKVEKFGIPLCDFKVYRLVN